MSKFSYGYKLLVDFAGFAKQNKVYWLVPLMVLLGMSAVLIVASHAIAPFIYTLF
jgi:hypothetical protein